ncbi:MAG: bifunctional adenosylcobinamide kinase/adenosylcobinamide-phosphate guanylyltransferase [Rhodobacteraceae bacterium]|nr:bifunctional adenosylcobinamide kinase/adenosylcobinamide-phosphate guanylyltransferase [Paracoccaceae bacterium]
MNSVGGSKGCVQIVKFPQLSLVLGGAASGKSDFAESLARSSGLPRSYIATAQAFDNEMREKIIKHQRNRGTDWTTSEAAIDLCQAITDQPQNNVILVDCLTLWLSNMLLEERDVTNTCTDLLAACADRQRPVVCVSNEVGLGIVPDSALARKFREAQGRLNREIAAKADFVVLVIAGIPQVLKGELPKVHT